ncbi:unnamed protein product [Ceutorhynchus assimilis]|uniref:Uncharacterized protein n=1 Tax=Ceutorhynchus assimilis TaxID=467358 RepID=A0A9P0GJI3_9CUCU|nr:unnamed protein product [Ceutorhynchus assimilis]
MWKSAIILILPVAFIVHGQDYGNLDNLGERISAQVRHQLAPLDGLGERINAQVQNDLRPMQVNLQNRLSDLEGLGDRISQKVHQNLEPVRAIELNFKMKDGVGGSTIATHSPGGRQFVIKNHRTYTCASPIDLTTGQCSNLISFKITLSSPKSDWCYIQSYSIINNQVCLSTGSVSIQAFNNQVNCKSFYDEPLLKIDLEDYKRLCAGVRESTEYRYIPDLNDDRHVEIPNENRYVKCENRQKDLCVFRERNDLLDSAMSSGPGGVFIQSRVNY